ncbi:MAG: 3-oxoacyl-[acyl-carrier-protein] reductase [Candidatus Lambdaproteobacteria bacterium]|nr:3-oxoacyl-[acyl-carrier-protein] reductase [Candidatus Lambdaproteobacteria bacterium]
MSEQQRVALVTGAGRGIGKAIALELAAAGCDIVFTNRTPSTAAATQAEIEALGRKCLAVQADAASAEQAEDVVRRAGEAFGAIDVLVNNAAVTKDGLLLRMTPEDWRQVLATNLDGMFYITRAVIRGMVRKRYGRIVNITSVVGFTGNPGQVNYSASKAAVTGFTKSIAKELASRNITCNAVAPGFIDTDMTRGLSAEQKRAILAQVPLGRLGTAVEVAKAVRFLASDDAAYITGTTLHVNGGMY